MALVGTFRADFESFFAAVQKAEVSLRSFETGAGKVEKALNKAADSFSGRKIIQDAHLAAEAVERIGGASKLTADEQRKVNQTVTEALNKYRALGQEAPAALQKIAADTRQIPAELGKTNTGLSTMISGLKSAAGLLGIAFSARALVGFVGGVFDAASKVKDLSTQLGISTNAVQGFKFAAEQSGSSLDAVGTAIQKMNQNLSIGDKSTVEALAKAGLKFEDIRNMKPEDAFLSIADAIQKIPDPMLQSEVALRLFGRGAAEILPGIKEGFRGLSDSASKMSEQTIKDLEAAQDAWERLFNKVTIVSGGIIASAMSITEHVTASGKALAEYAANAIRYGLVVANQMAAIAAQQKSTFDNLASMVSTFKPPGAPASGGETPKAPTAASLGTPAVNEHAKAVKALMDAFSGAKVIATANLHLEAVAGAMRQGIPLAKMTRDQQDAINKSMASAMEVYRSLGTEVPPAIKAVYFATLDVGKGIPLVAGLSSEYARLGSVIGVTATEAGRAVPIVSGLSAEFGRMGVAINVAAQETVKLGQTLRESLMKTLEQIPALLVSAFTGGGGMKGAVTSIGTMIGASIGGSIGTALGGPLGGAIGSALGSLGGSLVGKLFGGSGGRDLVKDFAGSMGGFDALRKTLNSLGSEGERLWVVLTQGTGKNNPTQAQAAIDAITAALAKQKDTQAEAAAAAGIASEAQVEATSKALDAITAMDDELKSLFKSIENEAPEEVMGIIEANTRAQIAGIQKERDAAQLALEQTAGDAARTAEEAAKLIEQTLGAHDFRVKVKIDLDDPSGILSGKVAGGILSRGSGSYGPVGDSGNITIVSQTVLDGEVLAESLATTLKRQGVR